MGAGVKVNELKLWGRRAAQLMFFIHMEATIMKQVPRRGRVYVKPGCFVTTGGARPSGVDAMGQGQGPMGAGGAEADAPGRVRVQGARRGVVLYARGSLE